MVVPPQSLIPGYPASESPLGISFNHESIQIGRYLYKNQITLVVGEAGVYTSYVPLFLSLSLASFIPWEHISYIRQQRFFFR